MRNVQIISEGLSNGVREEIVTCTPIDNLRRIDDLNHKLCETQRRLDSVQDELRTHQRFVADTCGIAAIFMVLICILVGYLLWRTAWL